MTDDAIKGKVKRSPELFQFTDNISWRAVTADGAEQEVWTRKQRTARQQGNFSDLL